MGTSHGESTLCPPSSPSSARPAANQPTCRCSRKSIWSIVTPTTSTITLRSNLRMCSPSPRVPLPGLRVEVLALLLQPVQEVDLLAPHPLLWHLHRHGVGRRAGSDGLHPHLVRHADLQGAGDQLRLPEEAVRSVRALLPGPLLRRM